MTFVAEEQQSAQGLKSSERCGDRDPTLQKVGAICTREKVQE